MSNLAVSLSSETVERVLLNGDLSRLSSTEKLNYYSNVCQSLGLNALTQPFAYIKLNGKEVLYAKRDCTDQLRKVHKVSIKITAREMINGVYVVTAQANMGDRCDESTGAVAVEGLKGETLANAYLKAETKAKRRVTLSLCGLGLLDESEVDSIPDAQIVRPETPPKNPLKEVKEAKKVASTNPASYVCTFGKYKGQCVGDIDIFELNNYCDYITGEAEKSQKSIQGKVKEFLEAAESFLKSREPNQQMADSDWDAV